MGDAIKPSKANSKPVQSSLLYLHASCPTRRHQSHCVLMCNVSSHVVIPCKYALSCHVMLTVTAAVLHMLNYCLACLSACRLSICCTMYSLCKSQRIAVGLKRSVFRTRFSPSSCCDGCSCTQADDVMYGATQHEQAAGGWTDPIWGPRGRPP